VTVIQKLITVCGMFMGVVKHVKSMEKMSRQSKNTRMGQVMHMGNGKKNM
jgi:hypothetical protein